MELEKSSSVSFFSDAIARKRKTKEPSNKISN